MAVTGSHLSDVSLVVTDAADQGDARAAYNQMTSFRRAGVRVNLMSTLNSVDFVAISTDIGSNNRAYGRDKGIYRADLVLIYRQLLTRTSLFGHKNVTKMTAPCMIYPRTNDADLEKATEN